MSPFHHLQLPLWEGPSNGSASITTLPAQLRKSFFALGYCGNNLTGVTHGTAS